MFVQEAVLVMGLGLGLANSPNWVRVMVKASSLTRLRKVSEAPRFTTVGTMLNLPAWEKGQPAE